MFLIYLVLVLCFQHFTFVFNSKNDELFVKFFQISVKNNENGLERPIFLWLFMNLFQKAHAKYQMVKRGDV